MTKDRLAAIFLRIGKSLLEDGIRFSCRKYVPSQHLMVVGTFSHRSLTAAFFMDLRDGADYTEAAVRGMAVEAFKELKRRIGDAFPR